MNKRVELHNKLVEILGSKNVYYQPPENLKMEYPCIRYSRAFIDTKKANNKNYMINTQYNLVFINKHPENDAVYKTLETFEMVSFDRHYVSDNLNHDILTLFY